MANNQITQQDLVRAMEEMNSRLLASERAENERNAEIIRLKQELEARNAESGSRHVTQEAVNAFFRPVKKQEKVKYTGSDRRQMKETRQANRLRYETLTDVIIEFLEDSEVEKWRKEVAEKTAVHEAVQPYQVVRRCRKEDYVAGMYVYGKSDSEDSEEE